jgi:hypothetical protein
LRSGAKLLDLAVDLSAEFPQDCPPISYFRVILREPAVVRQLSVETGQDCEIGTELCLLTAGPDEPIDGQPTRDVRAVAVGIIYESGFDEAMI